jgi:cytochrome c
VLTRALTTGCASALILLLAACGSSTHLSEAQQQAAWGEAVYANNCARCHAAGRSIPTPNEQELVSRFETAATLEAFVERNMPYDRPHSLPTSDYWAVTAYLLGHAGLLDTHTSKPLSAAIAAKLELARAAATEGATG